MAVQNLDFNTPADYTFNASDIEIVSGNVSLKKNIYPDELFYVNYNEDDNPTANRSLGSKYSISRSAPISNGYLDLTGGAKTYVSYDSDNLAGFTNTGCVRIGFVPDYSGSPPSGQYLFSTSSVSGNTNIFIVQHEPGGNIRVQIFSSAGGSLIDMYAAFVAVAGQFYVLEVNFDATSGASRVFLDGVQLGVTNTSIGVRTENQTSINVGISHSLNGFTSIKIDYLQLFSEVQHTANFDPNEYLENYSSSPASIQNKTSIIASEIYGLYPCAREEVDADAKYCINVNGTDKYFDGTNWVTSTGSSQSNDSETINTNIAALDLSSGETILITSYLQTTDGEYTPQLKNITMSYEGIISIPGEILECIVTGIFKDAYGEPIVGAIVKFIPNSFWYDQTYIFEEVSVVTDINGEISASIVETESSSATMNIKVIYDDEKVILYKDKVIPNSATAPLSSII